MTPKSCRRFMWAWVSLTLPLTLFNTSIIIDSVFKIDNATGERISTSTWQLIISINLVSRISWISSLMICAVYHPCPLLSLEKCSHPLPVVQAVSLLAPGARCSRFKKHLCLHYSDRFQKATSRRICQSRNFEENLRNMMALRQQLKMTTRPWWWQMQKICPDPPRYLWMEPVLWI